MRYEPMNKNRVTEEELVLYRDMNRKNGLHQACIAMLTVCIGVISIVHGSTVFGILDIGIAAWWVVKAVQSFVLSKKTQDVLEHFRKVLENATKEPIDLSASVQEENE